MKTFQFAHIFPTVLPTECKKCTHTGHTGCNAYTLPKSSYFMLSYVFVLRSSKVYAVPSSRWGHPKTLPE